jgi:hypothetical protein
MADPSGMTFAGADNKKARLRTCKERSRHLCAAADALMCALAARAQPIGGHVLAHASTTRLYLKKGTRGVAHRLLLLESI